MTPNKIALALALVAFALPMGAMAQDAAATDETAEAAQDQAPAAASEDAAEEESSNFSWNLTFASDYVFRGITQTNFDPAVQAGLDYAFGDTGLYVGAWASNVDFADSDGPDIELDAYIGWSHDMAEDWNLDLHAVRYTYLGSRDVYGDIDYNEYFAKVSYKGQIDFTVAYANDYANSGFSSLYYQLAGSWDVGNDFAINAGFGHTDFSDDVGGYNDWNIGVSRQWGPVNVGLNYYDTSGDFVDGFGKTSDRVVLTLGFGG